MDYIDSVTYTIYGVIIHLYSYRIILCSLYVPVANFWEAVAHPAPPPGSYAYAYGV